MAWLVWRRQRAALLLGFGIVVVLAVTLVVGREVLLGRATAAGLVDCLGRGIDACGSPSYVAFQNDLQVFWGSCHSFLLIVPAIVGTAAGAGLFGREFDRGTYVFALTQSVSRLRWWTVGLCVAGLPSAAAVGLLSPLTTWSFAPFDGTFPVIGLFAPIFETSGVVPVAYALLAFSLASTAGLVIKSSIGGAAVALLGQLVAEFALGQLARRSYLPPEVAYGSITETSGFLDSAPLPEGALRLSDGYVAASGSLAPDSLTSCTTVDCLKQSGYSAAYAVYQPIERYWPFQAIESATCLVLTAVVLAVGFLTLRKRVT